MFEYLLSGAFTGIVGAVISRIGDYMNKKQDLEIVKLKNENELALREADERIMKAEWVGRNLTAQTEGQAAMDVADSRAFQVSMTSEPQLYSNQKIITTGQNWVMVILDFIRGFIRPGLTAYMVVLTSIIYFMEDSQDNKTAIIKQILSVTTTIVLWWFGSRTKNSIKK